MSVDPSVEQLRRAARDHLAAATQALGESGGIPGSAAYLGHVATECNLKVRLLRWYRKPRVGAMQTALGDELFSLLFHSKDGHNLAVLAEHAGLQRLLEAERRTELLRGKVWSRMSHGDRPYSLRYGTERLARGAAGEELDVARDIDQIVDKT